jgi:hypothetical protein
LAFQNVTAVIRTTVVRLRDGGGSSSLLVHGPQWPTGEYCALLSELGAVKHVVVPCNALEHKSPAKDFLRRYPDASVWVAPGQYGPFGSCGLTWDESTSKTMGYRVDGILGVDQENAPRPPWSSEFEYRTLYLDLPGNAGPVSEVAMFHRPTRTLIAPDAVQYVPDANPAVDLFETYFGADAVADPTFWPRTVLQSVFLPLRSVQQQDGRQATYPGYEALKNRWIRAPILRGFNDARAPVETAAWVKQVATWDFDRIISSHFAAPVSATPTDFVNAFAYLLEDGKMDKLPPIACQDWELLDGLNDLIAKNKLGAPATFDYRRGCVP